MHCADGVTGSTLSVLRHLGAVPRRDGPVAAECQGASAAAGVPVALLQPDSRVPGRPGLHGFRPVAVKAAITLDLHSLR